MDHFLRRLESSDQEAAAALDASALSPNSSANPWQYLPSSDPSSPTLQRDFYNLSHSPGPSEYPWMLQELEQQRAAMFQAPSSDDVGQRDGARATLLQRRREHLNPVSDLVREFPTTGAQGAALQSDAMLYEELAAAWYRSGGHFRADSASPQGCEGQLQGLWDGALLQAYASEENFARLDNSLGFQNADAASANPHFDPRDEAAARMRWQRSMHGQFLDSSETPPEATKMDTRAPPSTAVDAGGNAILSTNEAPGSPNTSLSSGSGDDSDDEESTRNADPPSLRVGGELLDSSGKRKNPTTSENLEDKDNSTITELRKTAPSE